MGAAARLPALTTSPARHITAKESGHEPVASREEAVAPAAQLGEIGAAPG